MAQTQLTSKTRVKSLLGISGSSYDAVIDSLINGLSSFIEGVCNRIFQEATYTDEFFDGVEGRFIYPTEYPVTTLTSLFYNSGTPANPVWVAFDANYYVLDKRNNAIYFDAGMPCGFRNIKATYVAGYKIDWTAETDSAKHTLPFDLSMIVDELVTKAFNKRKSQGYSNENIDGASVGYDKEMTAEQKSVISKYQKIIL
jgi:hypothetical protein